MSLTTRVGLLAGVSALSLAGVSLAGTPQDYEARIAELEAKVNELGGNNWLTEQRADEIRGLVHDVLADADTRASLLQGMGGGYDDGFVLGTSDGSFSLRLNGQMQVRWNYNQQDNSPTDDNRSGFENARTKLMFSGNVGGPEWMYYIESDFHNDGGGDFELEDAWLAYDLGNDWVVKMGQFKVPGQREYLVHSSNQLAVERSLMSYTYANASRTQGIAFDYQSDQFHLVAGYTDGAAGANSPYSAYDVEWAFSVRAEYLMSGNWAAFKDFTSAPGSEQSVLIGGAIHYQTDEYGTAATETDRLLLTGDISIELDGANIFFAVNYQDNDTNGFGMDTSPLGFVVQGGLYFNDTMEGFVRYEYNDFDDAGEDLGLLTIGLNSYYNDNVKSTIDLGWGNDPVRSAASGPLTGWRDDAAGEDGQLLLRTQLQLTF